MKSVNCRRTAKDMRNLRCAECHTINYLTLERKGLEDYQTIWERIRTNCRTKSIKSKMSLIYTWGHRGYTRTVLGIGAGRLGKGGTRPCRMFSFGTSHTSRLGVSRISTECVSYSCILWNSDCLSNRCKSMKDLFCNYKVHSSTALLFPAKF